MRKTTPGASLRRKRRPKQLLVSYAMLLPFLFFFFLMFVMPIFVSLFMSFTNVNICLLYTSVLAMNQVYRKIIMLTGVHPDVNRDYNLEDDIPEPVSYTHLDVYKRQGMDKRLCYPSQFL